MKIDLIYSIYFRLKRKQKAAKEEGKQLSSADQKILNYSEWYFNVLLKKLYTKHPSKKYGITKEKRDQKIIVSLTSFPKRINTVWLTLETLLRQSVKPDEVILWLADSQFPGKYDDLPESLLRLRERGLTIRFCDDLRSHKKYFYTMQEYPDDLIILADDDAFYPQDMIASLLEMHEKNPEDICTMSAQVISGDLPSGWRNPYLNERFVHSSEIQVYTGSGSLFPPSALHPDAFNQERMKELCPYADDLWLTFMAHMKQTKITAYYPWRAFPVFIDNTATDSLYYINVEDGQNDIQWQKLNEFYGVDSRS